MRNPFSGVSHEPKITRPRCSGKPWSPPSGKVDPCVPWPDDFESVCVRCRPGSHELRANVLIESTGRIILEEEDEKGVRHLPGSKTWLCDFGRNSKSSAHSETMVPRPSARSFSDGESSHCHRAGPSGGSFSGVACWTVESVCVALRRLPVGICPRSQLGRLSWRALTSSRGWSSVVEPMSWFSMG